MSINSPSIKILGSRIHTLPLRKVLQLMEQWIHAPQNERCLHRIIVTGFHGIWKAYQDPELKQILNSADIWVPDGIAPVAIAKLQGLGEIQRIPGAELMQAFFELADQKGYRSFFYGDTDKTLNGLREKLENSYPGHEVVGAISPPFRTLTEEEDEKMIQMINQAKPDVLWVALGMPKQDRWIFEHRDRLKVPVAIGVGAAFAFVSGDVKRVPEPIGAWGLEWLWRLIMEPSKLWRRDFIDGPRFLWHVARELIQERRGTRPGPKGGA